MGQNLIMNVADHGFTVVVFNRTVAKVDRFLANEAKGTYSFRAVSKVEWLDSVDFPEQEMTVLSELSQSKSSFQNSRSHDELCFWSWQAHQLTNLSTPCFHL